MWARTWDRNWEIYALREQGLTLREIGGKFGISGNRVAQIIVVGTWLKQGWQQGEVPPDGRSSILKTDVTPTVEK